jgi:hypothetical protein
MRDRRQGGGIVDVDDEPGDLVGLAGNGRCREKSGERQVGQRILGGHALLARLRRDAGQHVAAAQRRGLGEQRHQIGKDVALAADGRAVHAACPSGDPAGNPTIMQSKRHRHVTTGPLPC